MFFPLVVIALSKIKITKIISYVKLKPILDTGDKAEYQDGKMKWASSWDYGTYHTGDHQQR